MLELTIPWKEQNSLCKKERKYEHLVKGCQANGWKASCHPVEVGCRGFAEQSVVRALAVLGIVGKTRRKTISAITTRAEDASRWLWMKRENQWKNRVERKEQGCIGPGGRRTANWFGVRHDQPGWHTFGGRRRKCRNV